MSEARRLEIIEQILKKLSETNVLDAIRQANAVPFQLPKYVNHWYSFPFASLSSRNTQMQKNVANRIEDLMGSDVVMLNDQSYMKNLCRRLDEKRQVNNDISN